jgi:replicative DNA helicase
VGKTLTKCAIASNILLQNKHVLYISVEEHREKIGKIIYSNIMDIKQDDMKFLTRQQFHKLAKDIYERVQHNIVIESRAPSSMCSNDIKAFIKDLRVKKKFVPDIVFVDYIKNLLPNNFQKTRAKHDNLEEVAKELRQVAIDMDVPLVTSQQLNRGGYNSAEAELGDIGDSFGITQPMDVIVAITVPDGFKEQRKYMFDIKKNRNKYKYEKFILDVEGEKCRLTDSEEELEKMKNDSKTESIAENVSKGLLNRKIQNSNEKIKKTFDIDMEDE